MKYLLLIYTNHDAWANLSESEAAAISAEYGAIAGRLGESGELLGGDALQGPETATTLRVRDGSRTVTDGPYIETKEHLAGYFLVDCASLDRALDIAADIPDARLGGAIEVRPLGDM